MFTLAFVEAAFFVAACSGPADVVATRNLPGGSYDPNHPPTLLTLAGDLDVHDPGIFKANAGYYLFHSGPGIATKAADDLRDWRSTASLFRSNPAWISEIIPDATELWAPDLAFFGDSFHLYYAASNFGSGRSCIGHATAAAIDASEAFVDRGPVICSNTGPAIDDWNAIDPNLVVDRDGTPWLAFGSFGSGIKLARLGSTGQRADDALYPLAARPSDGRALQASALMVRGDYYYLFVSFDACCLGADSTHRLMVGRSRDVTGPYLDRAGTPMLEGGGSLVLESGTRYRGPGSNDVLLDGARVYNVYHAYDANSGGQATLRIAEMVFDSMGWPISGGP